LGSHAVSSVEYNGAVADEHSDLLLGIKRCHDAGVSHRDVKPENICFNGDGILTLIDFGLVEELNPAGSRCTRGTPSMMAPELVAFNQCRDKGRSDHALPSMDARKLDTFAAG
jgi:serine/threonine protein kinase